jgi:hypothetical protein
MRIQPLFPASLVLGVSTFVWIHLLGSALIAQAINPQQEEGRWVTPRLAARMTTDKEGSSPVPASSPAESSQAGAAASDGASADGQSRTGWKADSNSSAGITRITRGLDVLPNEDGQVWRTYDISPYVAQIRDVKKPQQAIVDWILRETGTDLWFHEPLGILSSTDDAILVYHTPEIQTKVQQIIDRFVSSRGKQELFSLRLMTVGNPNWRAKVYPMLKPVEVRTPGIEAWLLSKENAALLIGEFRKRSDFQQYNSPDVAIQVGQPYELSRFTPRTYIKSLRVPDFRFPQGQLESKTINEGFALEYSPLRSLDGRMMECSIRCEVDQIEKMQDVRLDAVDGTGRTIPVTIQIPQVASWRLLERFQWPADQVLLLSCGVVASPEPQTSGARLPFVGTGRRADALVLIECKGLLEKAEVPSTANLIRSQKR